MPPQECEILQSELQNLEPRILRESISVQISDPDEIREEVDLIMSWLKWQDLPHDKREILQNELLNLEPSLREVRVQKVAERRAIKIEQALTPKVSGDAYVQMVETQKLIDNIEPLPNRPDLGYLIYGDEMIVVQNSEVNAILLKQLSIYEQYLKQLSGYEQSKGYEIDPSTRMLEFSWDYEDQGLEWQQAHEDILARPAERISFTIHYDPFYWRNYEEFKGVEKEMIRRAKEFEKISRPPPRYTQAEFKDLGKQVRYKAFLLSFQGPLMSTMGGGWALAGTAFDYASTAKACEEEDFVGCSFGAILNIGPPAYTRIRSGKAPAPPPPKPKPTPVPAPITPTPITPPTTTAPKVAPEVTPAPKPTTQVPATQPLQRAWNDPMLTPDEAVQLYNSAGVKKPLGETAVRTKFQQRYRFNPTTRRWSKPHKLPGSRPPRAPTEPFMRDQLKKVSDPKHPLHGLVLEKQGADGKVTYDWHKTTRVTKTGKTQTGRYEGSETNPIVQAGHPDAYASGAPQKYVLEDADLNQLSGQTIESKGAYSFKIAVEVDGVWVELASLKQWERLGVVPKGTVAKAKR